jgi:predicted DNA-binding transcriptional regulator AlpA
VLIYKSGAWVFQYVIIERSKRMTQQAPGRSNKYAGRIQPGDLATTEEVCEVLGITPGAAAQMRYAGRGPKFIKITGRQVRYRWADVEAWLDQRSRTQTDGW